MTVTIYEGDCREYIPKVKADLRIKETQQLLLNGELSGFISL